MVNTTDVGADRMSSVRFRNRSTFAMFPRVAVKFISSTPTIQNTTEPVKGNMAGVQKPPVPIRRSAEPVVTTPAPEGLAMLLLGHDDRLPGSSRVLGPLQTL
jgi:hypothetical protein